MPRGPKKTLEQRLVEAHERRHQRDLRKELREEKVRQKYALRLANVRGKAAEERVRLMRELELLRSEGTAPRQFSFPTGEMRRVVTDYRQNQNWSIRKMAEFCQCEPRNIRQMEGADNSIYMLKPTLIRILKALHYVADEQEIERLVARVSGQGIEEEPAAVFPPEALGPKPKCARCGFRACICPRLVFGPPPTELATVDSPPKLGDEASVESDRVVKETAVSDRTPVEALADGDDWINF